MGGFGRIKGKEECCDYIIVSREKDLYWQKTKQSKTYSLAAITYTSFGYVLRSLIKLVAKINCKLKNLYYFIIV